jgi:hypothetical protein
MATPVPATKIDEHEIQKRVQLFFEFLNYDWDKSLKFHNYCKAHTYPENGKREEQEQFKKDFYVKKVNSELEKCFVFESDEEKECFLKYSWLYQNIGSLSGCFKPESPAFTPFKNYFYLAFVVCLPL